MDQQLAKGLTSKSQGPNQPEHRLRQTDTMPTHASFIDDTGAAAEGGRPCIVHCMGLCWQGVGLLQSMLWLVRPLTFAGQALGWPLAICCSGKFAEYADQDAH